MKQSRIMSLVESCTNVFVGFWLALATQYIVFPWFGMEVRFWEHLSIGAVFVFVSVCRSYALRRFFEWLRLEDDEWATPTREKLMRAITSIDPKKTPFKNPRNTPE